MKNQKGFANMVLVGIIVVLVILVAYLAWPKKSISPVVEQQQSTNTGHILAFEDAINQANFNEATRYLADKVYVLLEGSSCCGEVSASQAKMYLENETLGPVFTFNPNDAAVKEYLAFNASQYPSRRLMRPSPNLLYFDEYIMGVESDVSQINKASIGYKATNGKITDLFINKGRDDHRETSSLKTYTSSKDGYSFQYPGKLSLLDSNGIINLSHSIAFDNYDGGCDMKGDAVLSKTLGDFNLSINIVSGVVNPPYVDGNYSKGILNGKWSYMGVEGCGQTSYYFPISGNRTLVITKAEVQMLSNVVAPDIKAKILAVPGVISYEEAKVILDQILSTFKFTDSNASAENITVQVYFSRTGDKSAECDETGSVIRTIPKTVSMGVATLEELLKGPTAEEKANRYTTNIPSGSKLNSLVITNGEARADFNAITESGGGSCSMAARTNQISRTLLQFPAVKNVTISIDGRTKDIFQP
jgi:hypothetical protein